MGRWVFQLTCFFLVLLVSETLSAQDCEGLKAYEHPIEFKPEIYHAIKIESPISIDGKMDEEEWAKAPVTSDFVDIEGEIKPIPERKTNVKMLWDDKYLYIGAYLEEDHIWYTLTDRDAIIYRDDDFEVFIDANGDGHHYHEFELNANNTLFDLWMLYPYGVRKAHHYIIDWDGKGFESAVHLSGTANDPTDIDSFWSVEIAIPLKLVGGKRDFWRIDFSRVDWVVDIIDGNYVKRKHTPERNWVWSPTGYINMHKPETWGYLAFDSEFEIPEIEMFKWEMWKVYYQVKTFSRKNKTFPNSVECFTEDDRITISCSKYGYYIIGDFNGEIWTINNDALIERKRK